MLSCDRLTGLGGIAAATGIYLYFPYLVPVLGKSIVQLLAVGSLFASFTSFQEQDYVDSIEIIKEGTHKGKVQVQIAKTPFFNTTLICDASDISKNRIDPKNPTQKVQIRKGIDVSSGQSFESPRGFLLTEDAWQDQ